MDSVDDLDNIHRSTDWRRRLALWLKVENGRKPFKRFS